MTFGIALAVAATIACGPPVEAAAREIRVDSVFLRLIEQVDVPAREAGVLESLAVQEGSLVAEGDQLAAIEDGEARLAKQRAQLDLQIAAAQAENRLGVDLAKKALAEAEQTQRQLNLELQIARSKAENTTQVRYAEKAVAVAKLELERAQKARQAFPAAVSQSEIDSLQLALDRTTLEGEQAGRELDIAELNRQIKVSEIENLELAVDRHRLEVAQTLHAVEIARLTHLVKANELAVAAGKVDRRQVASPINGVVVEVYRNRGEWVEPGDKVMRILRLNRLRAEGFIDMRDAQRDLDGARVTLEVTLAGERRMKFAGKVVFVSPEIDPVNGQVRIWAEIENPEYALRPGMRAALTIHGD